jgi:hypothetical protein
MDPCISIENPVNTAHTKVGDSGELTAEEQNELRKCEKAIELAEKNTAIVAMALLSVRDGYLYRVHYLTFEIYCRQRWKRGSTYAYDLIRFATILREFSAIADIKILPEYEGQTRPLGILITYRLGRCRGRSARNRRRREFY